VKQFVIACSLGLLGATSAVQAATVTVDGGNVYFNVDSAFLSGATVSGGSGQLAFDLADFVASSSGLSELVYTLDSYTGSALPISIVAKPGYVITGLTESASGRYSVLAGAGSDANALATAGVMSGWYVLDSTGTPVSNMLFGHDFRTLAQVSNGDSAKEQFNLSYSLSTGNVSAPNTVSMVGIVMGVGAFVQGDGSTAVSMLDSYRVSVQTAPVPEPGGMALLLAGLGVVCIKARRRMPL
jgi:hypothetical protein